MNYTNVRNLPKPLYDAVARKYTPKEKQYSVTTILKSTREILLCRRHDSELTKDISECAWALFGTAMHKVCEEGKETNEQFKEEYVNVEVNNGYKLSGYIDLFDALKKEVLDYKSTSVYKVKNHEYDDWKMQLLMYAWMLKKIGFEVDKGTIVYILRDWQKNGLLKEFDYPRFQLDTITFEFTQEDFDFAEKFINDKFLELERAEQLPDDELPLCTDEERWYKGTTYAVMKKGGKRAIKVFTDEFEALDFAISNKDYFVEKRIGENGKCKQYCDCCNFCNQWKKIQEEMKGTE